MYILLLAGVLIASYLFIPRVFHHVGDDWRLRLLGSAALSGGLLVLLTEGLSAFGMLEQKVLVLAWSAAIIALGCAAYFLRKNSSKPIIQIKPSLSLVEVIMLLGMTSLAAVMVLIAIVAAPNNDDSMLYHLTRVAQWQQNHSVAFFPAHNIKQLVFSPFSEYVFLNFHILSGVDQFDNLVQWFALVLSMVGVSFITKKLGAPRFVQVFSAVLVLTLPMSVYQSANTQNDLVLAMWIVLLICFCYASFEERTLFNVLMIGLAIGLAFLTKATAYIFVPVVVVGYISAILWKRISFRVVHVLLTVLLVLSINLPFWVRNYRFSGSPLGPVELSRLHVNEEFSIYGTTLNTLRNLGSNLFFLEDQAPRMSEELVRFLLTLNIDLNDPRFTFPGYEYRLPGYSNVYTGAYALHVMVGGTYVSEETIGGFFHLSLAAFALFSLVLR